MPFCFGCWCSNVLSIAFSQGPPYFSKPIGDKSVDLGETLSVKIAPEGVGPFTFEVLKDGQPLAKSERYNC